MPKPDQSDDRTDAVSADVASMTDVATDTALVANLNDSMPSLFSDDQLADIKTLDDVFSQFEGGAIESVSDYGNGFTILEDKRQLIGQPFAIVQWRFAEGDYGVFVSAAIVTEDGRKFILNDGSSGIRAQLQQVTVKRVKTGHSTPRAGLLCKEGLRVSDYTYEDPQTGKPTPASTFYLAQ